MSSITKKSSYVRNMIFGAEDSLVSTVGVVFGIATANPAKGLIVLSGLLVIAVEALSMGAGAYLSEISEQELDENKENDKIIPIIDGLVMFLSYFFAGFIPLSPYFFLEPNTAKYISILFSVAALFFLGYLPTRRIKSAVRMAVVAGLAILLGFLIATLSKLYLGV